MKLTSVVWALLKNSASYMENIKKRGNKLIGDLFRLHIFCTLSDVPDVGSLPLSKASGWASPSKIAAVPLQSPLFSYLQDESADQLETFLVSPAALSSGTHSENTPQATGYSSHHVQGTINVLSGKGTTQGM